MKTLLIRILALLLVACMLLPLMVRAAEVTDDGHVIAQPELLEQFDFPDDWSADALRFCVGNGILKGRNDGLAPGANITRAETAAILVRLLGAVSAEPDLSRFTDADPAAWYYPELAAAVEQGILKGTGETTLNPDGFVTREQAVVMLSRAFGIHAEDPYYWKTFSDSEDCAGYARYAVSALAEQEILKAVHRQQLPIVKNVCPIDHKTERANVDALVRDLEAMYPGLPNKIISAMQKGELAGW
jgi:hypothetical protein